MTMRGARAKKRAMPLTAATMALVLETTLPRRNAYLPPNTTELLAEATRFGITTTQQFRRLMLKHRRELIADDRAASSDDGYVRGIADDYGEAKARDMRRRQYCLSQEAMTRTAFELEFGEAYDAFSRQRDGL